MSQKDKKSSKFNLRDLNYYFDSEQSLSLDARKLNRKNGQWLDIRDKLLKLPDELYESTIQAIESLVSHSRGGESLNSDKNPASHSWKEKNSMFLELNSSLAGYNKDKTAK